MSLIRKHAQRTQRRKLRVRKRLKKFESPRVSVFKSLKHIYAQIIDDTKQTTLASVSTLSLEAQGTKKEKARAVGLELAKLAKGLGIQAAIFDRGQFLYHGRVKELAEGLREGGLKV